MSNENLALTFQDNTGRLPSRGWFHLCIFCFSATSKTEKVEEHIAYICKQCSKRYDKKEKLKFIQDTYVLFTKI